MISFLPPQQMPSRQAALRDAKSDSPESRWVAAMALGQVDGSDEKVREALFALLCDEVAEVRAQAIEGLLERSYRGATIDHSFLGDALKDSAPCVRCAAIDAACAISPNPAPDISALIADPDPSVRAAAVSAIGYLGAVHCSDETAKTLDDPSPFVAQNAALALAELGDPRGQARLVDALEQGGADAVDAASGLGKLGLPSAAPALSRIADRTICSVELRAMAAAAMIRCGDKRGVPLLERFVSGRLQSTRMTTLTVIARLPVKEMETALRSVADGPTEMEAAAAREILHILKADSNPI